MIFNILMDAVVRAVVAVFCGTQGAHHGMGWVAGERNLLFYADDGHIAEGDHIWVQDYLTVTLLMFRRVVLETNL